VILREVAVEFDVTEQAILYALRRLKVIHKKTMRYSKRDHNKRIFYLRAGIRKIIKEQGSANVISFDEFRF
jgi:Zn-dependent peptidase ImmA (M78 family)